MRCVFRSTADLWGRFLTEAQAELAVPHRSKKLRIALLTAAVFAALC